MRNSFASNNINLTIEHPGKALSTGFTNQVHSPGELHVAEFCGLGSQVKPKSMTAEYFPEN